MDNFNGITVHLNHRDITMAAVSRAPYAKIAAYKKRMGWSFPWVSSHASDFNFDYYVSFTDEELKAKEAEYNYRLEPSAITQGPGISVFLKDGGQIYHTYSTYARGLDMLNVAYHYMELVPKGRDEGDGGATAWVRPSRRVSGLMDGGRLLPALGLVRQARPAGFCPACRVLMKALDARPELARPMVAALVVLAVAGVAWAAMVHHSRSMAGMEGMDMGLGPIKSFAATWVVMMAAMMLPSAIPVVLEFARTAECRRAWPIATGMLAVTYLGVWLLFGVVCYAIYTALRMPWPNQSVIAGLALALAGVYSFSPIKRASQARCRELYALHGPLPFNLMRSAVVAGARYGLSCLGCSAALMVAMVLVGMSSLWWAVILGVVVLVYKLAPPLPLRYELALSAALVALGVAYVMAA